MKTPIVAKTAVAIVALGALVLLLLYLQGTIGGKKVPPGTVLPPPGGAPAAGARLAIVEQREVEDYLEWAGTVRSKTEARVSPKVMARVLEVRVAVGQAVRAGEVLAVLDDRDLRARLEQARSALAAAEAEAAEAESDFERVRALFEKEAATRRDFEGAQARAKALQAQVARARDAVREAEVLLGEAKVLAPFDGVVSEKNVEPGDLAIPGQPIFLVQDPHRLRLEVQVPEACARAATIGAEVRIRIDALEREITGRIEEVAPAADPVSRSFLVKGALPEIPELRAGMFGRFLQPCGRRKALLLPREAVSRVGQLEVVTVGEPGGATRERHVKTGKVFGDRVEVLSGLAEGEMVVLP